MKMLTALNTLGTLAAASAPQVHATTRAACPEQYHHDNFIDPQYNYRNNPRYILSDITVSTSEGFNLNHFFNPSLYHELSHGETDSLGNLQRHSFEGHYLRPGFYGNPYEHLFYDRFGNTVQEDKGFATSLWMNVSHLTWGGLMNPPTQSRKIKFTFKDTSSDTDFCNMTKESYTLYYNVGQYGNPIYSFVGIMPGHKGGIPTAPLNYISMNYKDSDGAMKNSYTPVIFKHRISFTDFHTTAQDRGMKVLNPYMAIGQAGHDGVHGDYTYDYLDGFDWTKTNHKVHARGPEGQRIFYHLAYELAMHMYQALNIV